MNHHYGDDRHRFFFIFILTNIFRLEKVGKNLYGIAFPLCLDKFHDNETIGCLVLLKLISVTEASTRMIRVLIKHMEGFQLIR